MSRKPSEPGSKQAHRTISVQRLWAFRLAAIVLGPALLLSTIEIGSRVLGIGAPASFFVTMKIDGERRVVNNPSFTKKYFGRRLTRPSVPFNLPANKDPRVLRIFVLGGSAARGFPEPAFGMARQLDVLLQHAYPAAKFKVVNAAITAINSHVVREIAQDCARLEPDLFVVYLGNNEVVGPFGPGTVFTPLSQNRNFIHASIALRSTRTVQLAEMAINSLSTRVRPPRQWNGMEMFLKNQVAAGDKRLETMRAHFHANLSDICDTARTAGIPVALCTVGVNEHDCAPFASTHGRPLTRAELDCWTGHFRAGERFRKTHQYQAAVESFEAAMQIDNRHADLVYQAAVCHSTIGNHATARQLFATAVTLDTLRFRADEEINRVIRSVADAKRSEGVKLVNVEQALREYTPRETPGRELFYEHVHLRFAGNYVVAKTLLVGLQDLLPDAITSNGEPPILTEDICRRELAFSSFEQLQALETIQTVATRPPFTSDFHKSEGQTLKLEFEQVAKQAETVPLNAHLDVHAAAVAAENSHWMLHDRYAQILFRYARDLPAAEAQWRAAWRQVPHSFDVNHQLAVTLAAQQRPAEAIPFFAQALSAGLESPSVMLNAARTLGTQGDFKRAAALVRRAQLLRPAEAAPHLVWADLQTKRGDFDQAIESYQRALELKPNDAPVHSAMANLLAVVGKRAESIVSCRRAVKAAKLTGKTAFAEQIQLQLQKVMEE